MITFNPHTGELTLPTVTFGPATTRQQFLASEAAKTASINVKNEPWCSWQLKPINLGDAYQLHLAVYFHGETLSNLHLALGHPKFGSSWDDYSEAKEARRLEAQIRYLTEEWHAPPGEYSWGTIWAGRDPHDGTTSFTLRYQQ